MTFRVFGWIVSLQARHDVKRGVHSVTFNASWGRVWVILSP